jgi:G:T/U-mismatch repair DNA glycosylase
VLFVLQVCIGAPENEFSEAVMVEDLESTRSKGEVTIHDGQGVVNNANALNTVSAITEQFSNEVALLEKQAAELKVKAAAKMREQALAHVQSKQLIAEQDAAKKAENESMISTMIKQMEDHIVQKLQTVVHNEIAEAMKNQKKDHEILEMIASKATEWVAPSSFPKPAASFLEVAVKKDTCETIICLNKGKCFQDRCQCVNGHRGDRCETAPVCADNPCQNEGKCYKDTCLCVKGFTGRFCDEPPAQKDYCQGVHCLNGGRCQDGECLCSGEFSGSRCEVVPADPCKGILCLNEGTCYKGWCKCVNGFKGTKCEHDPCRDVSCLNGGKCSMGLCNCINNWIGKKCDIDPCDNVRCSNGGVCSRGKCHCKGHWMGSHCTVDLTEKAQFDATVKMIPETEVYTCDGKVIPLNDLADGKCPVTGSEPVSKTIAAHPSLANINPDYPCHFAKCRNGGECMKGKCVCPHGFEGSLCETDKCSLMKCLNGSICYLGRCKCADGFSGVACEVDACADMFCDNGGHCVAGKCMCAPDWTGHDCTRRSKIYKETVKEHEQLDKVDQSLQQLASSIENLKAAQDPTVLKQSIENGAAKVIEKLLNKDAEYHPPQWIGDATVNQVADSQEELDHKVKSVDLPWNKEKMPVALKDLEHANLLNIRAGENLTSIKNWMIEDSLKNSFIDVSEKLDVESDSNDEEDI